MNVLLVATEQQWLGTARMPHDLATAGWSVALLAPRGTLAERSRYVARIAHLPDHATPLQWVHAFAGTVRAVAPQLVIPCDDVSFRLLALLHVAPPANLQPALHAELAALIERSLGDPAHYRASVDKTLISPAAEAAGVRVPPYAIVEDAAAAERFAAQHGFPVVLKRGYSSGGLGVAVCPDPAALYREFARLATAPSLELDDAHARRFLVQAFVPGPTRYFAATAWQGEVLCGYAVDKVAGDPGGPASVVRYFDRPELFASVALLTRALGITGLFAPEYIVDVPWDDPELIEAFLAERHR
jgi:glutathione synthase/RimK-type ligase-like ATP-grasp enzyme